MFAIVKRIRVRNRGGPSTRFMFVIRHVRQIFETFVFGRLFGKNVKHFDTYLPNLLQHTKYCTKIKKIIVLCVFK